MNRPTKMFVTGSPGTGKTTLIKECVWPYIKNVGGFYTEEIREGRLRKGFMLKTFTQGSGVLAQKGLKTKVKLNKYGVDLNVLEKVGVPALKEALATKQVVVVDEIGTMEMMSKAFCEVLAELLIGGKPLLASIRLKAEPFSSQIKRMCDTKIVHVDHGHFVEAKRRVRSWMEEVCLL